MFKSFTSIADIARMFFAGNPTYLVFYVTATCNSRCKTCFNWEYNNPLHRSGDELTLDEIGKIAAKAGRLAYVTLGGGEPFLRSDIADICKLFYDLTSARIFAIPTNCLTPHVIAERTKTILEQCPEAVVRVSLSIDGIGQDHDFIRGVPGNFEKVTSTYELLDKLRKQHARLEILANTTFCKYNQDKIRDIHSYVTEHFCLDMYSITLIRGTTETADVGKVDLEKYAAAVKLFEESYFLNRVKSRHPLQRLLSILPVFTRREVLNTARSARRTYTCHAIRKQIVVDSFGGVFACEMLPEELGNLRNNNYDMSEVLRTSEVREMIASIDRRECNCTWECAIQHSVVHNIKKWPSLFYEAFFKP